MKLVFATNNLHKLKEVQEMLSNTIELLSLKDIGCFEDIEETESTLEGNAKLKADYITEKYGFDCFADDTGLEVEALDGDPGVYSARYAGEHGNAFPCSPAYLAEYTPGSPSNASTSNPVSSAKQSNPYFSVI